MNEHVVLIRRFLRSKTFYSLISPGKCSIGLFLVRPLFILTSRVRYIILCPFLSTTFTRRVASNCLGVLLLLSFGMGCLLIDAFIHSIVYLTDVSLSICLTSKMLLSPVSPAVLRVSIPKIHISDILKFSKESI